LKDERMIGVLQAVAEKFGYKPAKLPSGRDMACPAILMPIPM